MLKRLITFPFFSLMSTTIRRTMASTKVTLPQKVKPKALIPQTQPQPKQKLPQQKKEPAKTKSGKKGKIKHPLIKKLPATQSIDDIFRYYHTNYLRLNMSHYQILFSRLAHLKTTKVNTAHPTIHKMINGLCRMPLYKNPSVFSSIVKYTAIIGIKDRTLWTKFVRTLKYCKFEKRPIDLANIVGFFAKAKVRGESLWRDLQLETQRVLDSSLPGYKCIELLLQGFLWRKLEPDLEKKLISLVKQQASFVDLESLKNIVSYSLKLEFKDPELWSYLKKWSLYRLKKAESDNTFIPDQFTYMIYCFGRAAKKGLLSEELISNEALFKELFKYYLDARESIEKNPGKAVLAYHGFITGFDASGVFHQELHEAFNKFIVTERSALDVKDYGVLIQLIEEKGLGAYFGEEAAKVIQEYIIENAARFSIEQYYSVLKAVDKVETFDKQKLYSVLKSLVDFFIQTNSQHSLAPMILKEFEDKQIISSESIQEKKILFNLQ